VREQVSLSLRAAGLNPLEALVERVGQIETGPATRVVPIGVVVHIENREDGFEGLVLNGTGGGLDLAVADVIPVRIVEVDPARRHIHLAHAGRPRIEPSRSQCLSRRCGQWGCQAVPRGHSAMIDACPSL
jgi:hypothetical protein